jgi:hypothetical protein
MQAPTTALVLRYRDVMDKPLRENEDVTAYLTSQDQVQVSCMSQLSLVGVIALECSGHHEWSRLLVRNEMHITAHPGTAGSTAE